MLIISFLICYSISWIIDRKEKIKKFMISPKFDIVQFYIIKFTKEKLNKELTFFKLFQNLLKVFNFFSFFIFKNSTLIHILF